MWNAKVHGDEGLISAHSYVTGDENNLGPCHLHSNNTNHACRELLILSHYAPFFFDEIKDASLHDGGASIIERRFKNKIFATINSNTPLTSFSSVSILLK